MTTVNAEMRVGGIQETLTVTGDAPVVDIQTSTSREQVLSNDFVRALPASRGYGNYLAGVPGIQGTGLGASATPSNNFFTARGGRSSEGNIQIDGMNVGSSVGGGGVSGYQYDMSNASEVQVTIAGGLAEVDRGGPAFNMIPKTGGNDVQRVLLCEPGRQVVARQQHRRRAGKLWVRRPGGADSQLGHQLRVQRAHPARQDLVLRQRPDDWHVSGRAEPVREPECVQSQFVDLRARHRRARAELQLQEGHRHTPHLSGHAAPQARVLRRLHQELLRRSRTRQTAVSAARPETAGPRRVLASALACPPRHRSRARSGTIPRRSCRPPTRHRGRAASSSRRASRRSGPSGATFVRSVLPSIALPSPSSSPTTRTRTPNSNFIYHGWPATSGTIQQNAQYRASLSYVTGAHSFKAGYQGALMIAKTPSFLGQQISYRFNNGVPNQLTQRVGPTLTSNRTLPDAFFVQDQWTRSRLTVQGGLRYEHVRSYFPEGENGVVEAHRFGPAFTFPQNDGRARLQRHHASHGRILRPLRQRQDGAEGQHEQVPAGRVQRRRLHDQQPCRHAAADDEPRMDRRATRTSSPNATS